MAKAALLAVDDNAKVLGALERELEKRYGADYEVVCEDSAEVALGKLEELKAAGSEVAIVIADLWMPQMNGVEFLARAHAICPQVKRLRGRSRCSSCRTARCLTIPALPRLPKPLARAPHARGVCRGRRAA